MFRTVTGGATGSNLFNLNWVEFGGNGVTVVKTTHAGRRSAARCRPRCRCRWARRRRSGPFTPGVARTYHASTTANVISTAGDATLSVADPSSNATGRLVNGAFSLPQPLQVRAASAAGTGGAFAPVGGSAEPDDAADLRRAGLQRRGDGRRSSRRSAPTTRCAPAAYSKTLTFTLSTTTP